MSQLLTCGGDWISSLDSVLAGDPTKPLTEEEVETVKVVFSEVSEAAPRTRETTSGQQATPATAQTVSTKPEKPRISREIGQI